MRRHAEVDRPCLATGRPEHSRTRRAERPSIPFRDRGANARRNEHGEEASLIDSTPSWTAVALDETECRRLLAVPEFGRLVYTRGALPVVRPVRFSIHDGQVLIPIRTDGRLSRAVRGAVVAFEVDSLEAGTGSCWTVTAVGPARVLTDPGDIAAAVLATAQTWIPDGDCSYLAVQIGILRGCRVSLVTAPLSTSLTVGGLPQS